MSTKIELEFFSADEKLPEEQCDVMVVSKHDIPGREEPSPSYLQQNVSYSPKHERFNVYDRDTEEEAEMYTLRNVIAWAYQPDWSKVDV